MKNNPYREKIIVELELVLQDAKFSSAPKSSAFLRYIVLQTLIGNASRIKAYTIAIDALNKPPTFDPQMDPSVRVLAKRLRDNLSDYYRRTEGHEIFFKLVPGSYVPEFVYVASSDQSEPIGGFLKSSSL